MSEHRPVITEQLVKLWKAVQVAGIVVSLVGVFSISFASLNLGIIIVIGGSAFALLGKVLVRVAPRVPPPTPLRPPPKMIQKVTPGGVPYQL